MTQINFFVAGKPEPKGSPRVLRRGNHFALTVKTDKCAAWESLIRAGAHEHMRPAKGKRAWKVCLEFFLPRPKTVKNRKRAAVKPDLDKLIRAVLDALEGYFFNNDSEVVEICARKCYASADLIPGVEITVIAMPD